MVLFLILTTQTGRFLLLKKDPKEQSGYIHMAVSRYPEMTQFLQDIKGNMLTITYTAYGNTANSRIITLPLIPDTAKLDSFNVNMHDSPTSAFKMPEEYSTWFSACFGYEVLLVYLGENRRGVLFEDMLPKPKPFNPITSFLSIVLGRKATQENWEITFADCAPYLITSHTSLQDVSARLSSSPNSTTTSSTTSENPEAMDPTKFRPNLILHGAHTPWAEDFWTRLRLHGPGAEILLTHNCVRCSSINIDYATGKAGTGPAGQVLKKLQKDRRVDAGAKWSPVFGRYGFLVGREGVGEQKGEGMEGVAVRVGERVSVLEVSERRTVWSKLISLPPVV